MILEVKELRNMEVHETKMISSEIEVMKVIGGWIYTIKKSVKNNSDYLMTSTFVPELRI